MAKLVLADQLQALDFDLRPFADLAGTVTEPSQDAVTGLFRSIVDFARSSGVSDSDDPEQVKADVAAADPDVIGKFNDQAFDALARVCGARKRNDRWEGGFPSYPQLKAMPHRPFQLFAGWLLEELSPEGQGAATKSSPETQTTG